MMRPAAFAAVIAAAAACAPVANAAPVEVHPAGSSVPENLLRIELRFDRPLRGFFDVGQLRLVDAEGLPIEHAFLDLALPSADGRRVAVLLNPGRVKSGVGPNRALGRALHAGGQVRLVLDDPATGFGPVVKTWTITAFQSQGPQPRLWSLTPPTVHTRQALVVRLRAPISASSQEMIAVRDAAGRRVVGRTGLSGGDTVWTFVPAVPWQPGGHALVTHPDLEDPAGNRTCAAFEQPRASDARCDAGVTLPFSPARA